MLKFVMSLLIISGIGVFTCREFDTEEAGVNGMGTVRGVSRLFGLRPRRRQDSCWDSAWLIC